MSNHQMNDREKKLSLFALTWPIFIETFLHMLMGNVDIFMLSRISDQAVAAVGIANQIIVIAIVIFGFVIQGTEVVVSQYLGAGKRQDAGRISAVSLGLNFILGIVISAIMILFSNTYFKLMDVPNELTSYAQTYLWIVGGLYLFNLSI